jgi:osmoprotectant transport system permease protein
VLLSGAELAAQAPIVIEPAPNPWFSWSYVTSHTTQLWQAGQQHLMLTVTSVLLAIVIALPLALLVRRYRRLEGPVLAFGGVLYTIPSLALISVLWPVFGLSPWTVIVALAIYALLVVLRNSVVGLKGVPPDAIDAARGMGYSKVRILFKIEMPLAMPTILAGIRVATVSTVGLVTIGALVGYGGFGSLIYSGFLQNFWHAQIMTATLACVVLAIALEAGLQLAERMLTPWARSQREASA